MFETRYKSHHDVKATIDDLMKRKLVTSFSVSRQLKKSPEVKEAGIYVHTPYCDKICAFCNMNRKQVDNNLDSYTEYLCKEFDKYGSKKYVQEKTITSIFFGGGTPTIYKDYQLEKILSTLRKNFNFADDYEFTFETTLHNLTPSKLDVMMKYGVNRISIGVQTFSDRGRKVLNRTYDSEEVQRRIKEIRKQFNGLICIDIIYNYLDETVEEVQNDARTAIALGVDSVSFYSLMIHDGSKISKDLAANKVKFDYEIKKDKELHDKFLEITLANGFNILEHTKISNGKDGYKYIRNINSFSDLFAIGIGAGGRVGMVEYFHLNKLVTFYAEDTPFKYRVKKISGLLQYDTVNLNEVKELTGENIYPSILNLLKEFEKEGYLKINGDSFTYTIDGVFWGNSIVAKVVMKMIEMQKEDK